MFYQYEKESYHPLPQSFYEHGVTHGYETIQCLHITWKLLNPL